MTVNLIARGYNGFLDSICKTASFSPVFFFFVAFFARYGLYRVRYLLEKRRDGGGERKQSRESCSLLPLICKISFKFEIRPAARCKRNVRYRLVACAAGRVLGNSVQ